MSVYVMYVCYVMFDCVCVCVCVCVFMCLQHMCRSQKTPKNSLFPSFPEFWGPDSDYGASVVDSFDPLSHLVGKDYY